MHSHITPNELFYVILLSIELIWNEYTDERCIKVRNHGGIPSMKQTGELPIEKLDRRGKTKFELQITDFFHNRGLQIRSWWTSEESWNAHSSSTSRSRIIQANFDASYFTMLWNSTRYVILASPRS